MSTATGSSSLFYSLEFCTIFPDPFLRNNLLVLSGWCFDSDSREPVILEVQADGELLLEVECSIIREDVSAVYCEHEVVSSLPRCGFSSHVYVTDDMEWFELVSPQHRQVLARAPRSDLARECTPLLEPARFSPPAEDRPVESAYEAYVRNSTLGPHVRQMLSEGLKRFEHRPTFSLLMPGDRAVSTLFQPAVQSVIDQIYPDWELRVAFDPTSSPGVPESLRRFDDEERIVLVACSGVDGSCALANAAAEHAAGDFVAMVGQHDLLAPNALFEVVRYLQASCDTDLLYSDEDRIDLLDSRSEPLIKPDWSPVLLMGANYLGRLSCVRKSVFEAAGGFREGFGRAFEYDLALRVTERTARVGHVAKVLYSSRIVPEAIAPSQGGGLSPSAAAERAMLKHLERRSIQAEIRKWSPNDGEPKTLYLEWPDHGPRVDILILTAEPLKSVQTCIESIRLKTSYSDFTVTVVGRGSRQSTSEDQLESLASAGIRWSHPDDRSGEISRRGAVRAAAETSDAEFILVVNGLFEVLEPSWISQLMGFCRLPGVGATGGCVEEGDEKAASVDGVWRADSLEEPRIASWGRWPGRRSAALTRLARDVSWLRGDCLLIRKKHLLKTLKGKEGKSVDSWWIRDVCARLLDRELRCVQVPEARLGRLTKPSELQEKAPSELRAEETRGRDGGAPDVDLIVRPAAECRAERVSELDYGEFLPKPLKVMIFVHNLTREGGPKILLNSVSDFNSQPNLETQVVSFADGPLRKSVEAEGVNCQILELPGTRNILEKWRDRAQMERAVIKVSEFLKAEAVDVVMTVTLNSFFVVEAAYRCSIPSLWFIQESYPEEVMRQHIDWQVFDVCEQAFERAARVIFGSKDTRRVYERYDRRHNFSVIYNGLDIGEVDRYRRAVSKGRARAAIQAPPEAKIVLSVGTVCSRKQQETLVEAAEILARKRRDFRVYLVGARRGDAYSRMLEGMSRRAGLEQMVRLIPVTSKVHRYFRAADVLVSTSLIESFSFVILEAMAHGLPIVSTPACGVREQVQEGVNGLIFPFQDARALAEHLDVLLADPGEIKRLGRNSRRIAETMQKPSETTRQYVRLILAAWQTQRGDSGSSYNQENAASRAIERDVRRGNACDASN